MKKLLVVAIVCLLALAYIMVCIRISVAACGSTNVSVYEDGAIACR